MVADSALYDVVFPGVAILHILMPLDASLQCNFGLL